MSKAIPHIADYDWAAVHSMPIAAEDEALIDTQTLNHAKIVTRSDYFRQGIRHALPSCHLRASVAERLIQAADALPDGVNLLILDGWRPLALQRELVRLIGLEVAAKYPDATPAEQQKILSQFVAEPSDNPLCPSPHLTGGSVDLTLCDDNGTALDMGAGFDEPTARSWTHATEDEHATPEARRNRRLLYWAMIHAGFTNLPSEWWHFDYGNQLWAYFGKHAHARYGIAERS